MTDQFKFSYYIKAHVDSAPVTSIISYDKDFDGKTKGIITTSN